jgi:hypothetical protein
LVSLATSLHSEAIQESLIISFLISIHLPFQRFQGFRSHVPEYGMQMENIPKKKKKENDVYTELL